jgi:hypothetical protein
MGTSIEHFSVALSVKVYIAESLVQNNRTVSARS